MRYERVGADKVAVAVIRGRAAVGDHGGVSVEAVAGVGGAADVLDNAARRRVGGNAAAAPASQDAVADGDIGLRPGNGNARKRAGDAEESEPVQFKRDVAGDDGDAGFAGNAG